MLLEVGAGFGGCELAEGPGAGGADEGFLVVEAKGEGLGGIGRAASAEGEGGVAEKAAAFGSP